MRGLFSLSLILTALLIVLGCGEKVSVEEMFTNANQLQKEGHYEEAIKVYQKLIQEHPKSEYSPKAQFMIGFIYANELEDMDRAKLAYEKFVEDYPEHEMVSAAEWEIENLGRDINEIEELTTTEADSSR